MTLTALKIIAYLCNYLHVPGHCLRPEQYKNMHTGFFGVFSSLYIFSRWGLGFLHENHWGVDLSLPPTCAGAEGANQTSPHLGWRQEWHIQVIPKYNLNILWSTRSLCTDRLRGASQPFHLCWWKQQQDGHSLGNAGFSWHPSSTGCPGAGIWIWFQREHKSKCSYFFPFYTLKGSF